MNFIGTLSKSNSPTNNNSSSNSNNGIDNNSASPRMRRKAKAGMSPPPPPLSPRHDDTRGNPPSSSSTASSTISAKSHISANNLKMRHGKSPTKSISHNNSNISLFHKVQTNQSNGKLIHRHPHSHPHQYSMGVLSSNFSRSRSRSTSGSRSASPRPRTSTSLAMSASTDDANNATNDANNDDETNAQAIKTNKTNNHNTNNNDTTGIASFIIGKNEHSKRRKAAKTILSALSMNKNNNPNTNHNDSSQPSSSSTTMTKEEQIQMSLLQQENNILKQTIHQLTQENDSLQKSTTQLRLDLNNVYNSNTQTLKQIQQQQLQNQQSQQIVIEQFEGEGLPVMNEFGELVDPKSWWERGEEANGSNPRQSAATTATLPSLQSDLEGQIEFTPLMAQQPPSSSVVATSTTTENPDSCDEYEDGTCPIEPHLTFQDALRDRAYWLVGLLTLQSMSGFILQRNEVLLQSHPIIVYFLTMLVGAGGNAGNQAAVRGTYSCIDVFIPMYLCVTFIGTIPFLNVSLFLTYALLFSHFSQIFF